MSAEVLREAAKAMREQHGPEHKRHAMWQAMADWLEREAALANLLDMAGNTEQPEPGDTEHYALAVATAYLGKEQP